MFSRFCKKTVPLFLIISLVIPSGLLLYPKKTDAQVMTCMAKIAAFFGASKVASKILKMRVPIETEAQSQISNSGSFIQDCIFKPLVMQLAKTLLHNMTVSTVQWINNGFEGRPGFMQDLGGLLRDTADGVIGDFIAKDAAFLCSPFSFKLRVAIAQSNFPYRRQSRCTLTQVINNVNGFVEGNNNGGWGNWLQVTTVPQNNAFGAFVIAQDEISRRIIEETGIKVTNLNWGNGFKNWEYCETDSHSGEESCRPETPGKVIQDRLSATLNIDLQQIGLADDLNAVIDALSNQLVKQVVGGVKQGLFSGTRSRKSTITAKTYTAATQPLTLDPNSEMSTAINGSIRDSSGELGELINEYTTETTPIDICGVEGSPDTTGLPTGSQTLDLVLNPSTSVVVNDSTPLFYEIGLATNYKTNSLFMRTAFKRGDLDYAFLNVFDTIRVVCTRSDGTRSTTDIAPPNNGQALVNFRNVSTDNGKPFTVTLMGAKKAGAASGSYRLETVVYDTLGQSLDTQSNSIIVE